MADVHAYEPPVVTDVTEVDAPLVGVSIGSTPQQNPQWNDEPDES